MKQILKISKWVIVITGFLILLSAAVVFFLPSISNLELIRTRLLARLSAEIGADIKYERVKVFLIPRPGAAFYKASFSIRQNLEGRATVLYLYPAISSLLQGDIRLAALRLQQPDLKIRLPQPGQMPQFDFFGALDAAKPVVAAMLSSPSIGPNGLSVQIDEGRVSLQSGAENPISFTRIRTRIHSTPQLIRLNVRSGSNLWQNFTLDGRLNPQKWSGNGLIRLKRFRPERITGYLYPEAALKIRNARTDLKINYRLFAGRKFTIKTEGTLPQIDLVNRENNITLKGQRVRATVEMDRSHTTVSLGELQMDAPRLNASGNFYFGHQTPDVRLEVTGVDVDVGAFRRTAQHLVGHMRWVQKLFAVLKDGRVPLVSLSARSTSLETFGDIKNFIIRGRLSNGRIIIPGIEMELKDIRGDTIISNGILSGQNLQARYDNSSGSDGSLKLGLTDTDKQFHLDIDMDAKLSQLPPFLKKMFPDTDVARHSQAFHKTRGRAKGKLVLGDTLDNVRTRIAVSSFNLYTVHEKIPFPLIIRGGSVTIDGKRWTADQIKVQIGRTNFSQVFFALERRSEPIFTFTAGNTDADLAEMQTWLPFLALDHTKSGGLRILKGNAFLQDITVEGPLYRVDAWKSRLTGAIDNVLFQIPQLTDPVRLVDGNLKIVSYSAKKTNISIISSNMNWQNSHIRSVGAVTLSPVGLRLDLDIYTDHLNLGQIAEITRARARSGPAENTPRPVAGQVRVYTEAFELYGFTWQPVQADLHLNLDGVFVDITRAQICDIDFPGTLNFTAGRLALAFLPSADNQNIAGALGCLDNNQGLITGMFSVNGEIEADSAINDLPGSLRGELDLRAQKGRIYRYGMVSKILALLNVTEIFRGRLPDVTEEGFAYEKIKIKSTIRDGKLVIQESLIRGASMTIVSRGEIDLQNDQIEMTVLFAPFKSIDAIISNIPIVKDILGGKLMTIPFKVEGAIDQYEVIPMAPTSVDSGVFGLMKRTLRLPLTIMQPLQEGEYTFDESKIFKYRGSENIDSK